MKNLIKDKLIELKIKNRNALIVLNPNDYNTEEELLDTLASKIINKKSITIFFGEDLTDKEFLKLGEKVRTLCAEFDSTLLINNRTDIAFLLEADGIYLDESGISEQQARHILGENAIIIEKSFI